MFYGDAQPVASVEDVGGGPPRPLSVSSYVWHSSLLLLHPLVAQDRALCGAAVLRARTGLSATLSGMGAVLYSV